MYFSCILHGKKSSIVFFPFKNIQTWENNFWKYSLNYLASIPALDLKMLFFSFDFFFCRNARDSRLSASMIKINYWNRPKKDNVYRKIIIFCCCCCCQSAFLICCSILFWVVDQLQRNTNKSRNQGETRRMYAFLFGFRLFVCARTFFMLNHFWCAGII